MKRPPLREVPLSTVLPLGLRPGLVATMSVRQWDVLLEAFYNDGWVLLELDERERPVRAYGKTAGGKP